jgi:hypothetical protein
MNKALGVDDSVTICDCCGKRDLKSTVVIELTDGEIVHYGRVCASRNTGKDRRTITGEIKAHRLAQVAAARREYQMHPAFIAERTRFAERDALSWDDPRRRGMHAADFVREVRAASDAACREIAARFGVLAWEVSA